MDGFSPIMQNAFNDSAQTRPGTDVDKPRIITLSCGNPFIGRVADVFFGDKYSDISQLSDLLSLNGKTSRYEHRGCQSSIKIAKDWRMGKIGEWFVSDMLLDICGYKTYPDEKIGKDYSDKWVDLDTPKGSMSVKTTNNFHNGWVIQNEDPINCDRFALVFAREFSYGYRCSLCYWGEFNFTLGEMMIDRYKSNKKAIYPSDNCEIKRPREPSVKFGGVFADGAVGVAGK